jgi:hypothetical protein
VTSCCSPTTRRSTSGGAQLTFYDPLLGYAKYKTVDPVPPTVPDSAYGNSVTACLDASGATVGYAWQTEPGKFRVTQPNITPETP